MQSTRRARFTAAAGLTAAAAAAALLTGCSASGSGITTPGSGSPSAQQVSTARTVHWTDTTTIGHWRITVDKPHTFTTSGTAMPQQNTKAWAVKVTFRNVGSKTHNPAGLQVKGRTGSHNRQEVIDGPDYPGLISVGPVPAGQTITTRLAYLAGDGPKKFVVAQTMGDETVTYRG